MHEWKLDLQAELGGDRGCHKKSGKPLLYKPAAGYNYCVKWGYTGGTTNTDTYPWN